VNQVLNTRLCKSHQFMQVFLIDGSLRYTFIIFVSMYSGITGAQLPWCNQPSECPNTHFCPGTFWRAAPCQLKMCKCPNGTPKSGAACTTHDAAMCEKCDGGFTINAGQTECEAGELCSATPCSGSCILRHGRCIKIDCNRPEQAFVVKGGYPLGCAGAVWSSGAPSQGYCTNTGPNALDRFAWRKECCQWSKTGQCVDKNIDLTSWCNAGNKPTYAPALLDGFPHGCAGAVWIGAGQHQGKPSRSYCLNTAESRGRYGWRRHCCVWTGTSCADRNTQCSNVPMTPGSACYTKPGNVVIRDESTCKNTNPADKGKYAEIAYCCEWTAHSCRARKRECRVNDHGNEFRDVAGVDADCKQEGGHRRSRNDEPDCWKDVGIGGFFRERPISPGGMSHCTCRANHGPRHAVYARQERSAGQQNHHLPAQGADHATTDQNQVRMGRRLPEL